MQGKLLISSRYIESQINRRLRKDFADSIKLPLLLRRRVFIFQLASEYYLPIGLHILASIPFSISCESINRFPAEAEYYFQDAIHIDGSFNFPAMTLVFQPTSSNRIEIDLFWVLLLSS